MAIMWNISTPQMVARTATSQLNNFKNLLHLTRSAEIKKVSKFPTCQSYPVLPYIERYYGLIHLLKLIVFQMAFESECILPAVKIS